MADLLSDSDVLYQGVLNAIEAQDFEAAVEILEGLAGVDLERAVELYGDIQDALGMARIMHRLAGEGQ